MSRKLRTYNKSEYEKKTPRDSSKRRLKNKKRNERDNPEESVAIKRRGPRRQCYIEIACFYISHLYFLFAQMAENTKLQDVLMAELSDVNLFCKLIRYRPIRDNMLKTFKVR